MKLKFFRRQRSRWFRWEWHDYLGVRYLMISLGHPRRHAWWAFSLYLYLEVKTVLIRLDAEELRWVDGERAKFAQETGILASRANTIKALIRMEADPKKAVLIKGLTVGEPPEPCCPQWVKYGRHSTFCARRKAVRA